MSVRIHMKRLAMTYRGSGTSEDEELMWAYQDKIARMEWELKVARANLASLYERYERSDDD